SGEVKPSMPFYDECAFASLPIKDGVEIFILNPDNPMNVFAVPKESVVDLYQDLEVLSAEMNEYCNSLSTTYYEPQEGEICMARFSSDNLWYRAACIYQNKDSASVVFVDYGNQEEVSFKNICQMVDKFLAVPLIALHCRIKDFTPEEVFAGGSKLIEKFKALLPPNSSHIVNVVEKCDVSHVYVLEIPSLDMEGLKKG
ncbi:Tudor domain-containing protein 1, partial [Armadillidium nasatum]